MELTGLHGVLRLFARELFAITLFKLNDEDVEFLLKVLHLLTKIFIASQHAELS